MVAAHWVYGLEVTKISQPPEVSDPNFNRWLFLFWKSVTNVVAVPPAGQVLTTVPYGGTGVQTVTGYLKGNGTSPFTGVSQIPWSDISGKPIVQVYGPNITALDLTTTTGMYAVTAYGTSATRTLTGTAARISVTNGSGVSANPTFDIDATYVGQTSITTLGTITTGTWRAGTLNYRGADNASDTNSGFGVSVLAALSGGTNNAAVGNNALSSVVTGSNNVAVGWSASAAFTLSGQVAIGSNALLTNATSLLNTAVGFEALKLFNGGGAMTAVGHSALTAATTGYNCTAVGVSALAAVTDGYENSGFGKFVLGNLTTGFNNSALGSGTGLGITTGSGNTILGAGVIGLAAALTNNIILANGTGAIKAQHDGTGWALTGPATFTSTIQGTRLISTIAIGTAPLTVTSTTVVPNLYVARAVTADSATTNANLTGPITSIGNATSIASQTGTGTKFVVDTSPTLVTPVIGAATGTSLSVSGSLASTVATGTAPLVVTSTTVVNNLNVSQLLGNTWASPGVIGSTTPDVGYFTLINMNVANAGFEIGALGTANTPYIDFHSSSTANDWDARLVASGGTAAASNGTLTFYGLRYTVDAPVNLKSYTVAGLPAGTNNDTAFVTDALAPAFGAAVAGGGAVRIPVYYDGAWKVG